MRKVNVVKILLQPGGERGVVLLIVAATGKKDMGNQVIGAVLTSQIGSGEAVCPGGTPLRVCGALLGEHLKECAADAYDSSIFICCMRDCPACRKLSHGVRLGLRRERGRVDGGL